MAPADREDPHAIAVLHCFRPLVGGVFRHVIDLARGQAARGARVGIVCDSARGSDRTEKALDELAPHCALGVHRVRIKRRIQLSDFAARRTIAGICASTAPAIVHGHGAKGGAFARLCQSGARVVYTPHGGVLHYRPTSLAGRGYFTLERRLLQNTDGIVFESRFSARQFEAKIGAPGVPFRIVHNGLHPEEFTRVPGDDPSYDFVYAGELRKLKGLDTLLVAIQQLARRRSVTLLACGSGPDAAHFEARIRELGLEGRVTLRPPVTPITTALARARAVVVPSLSESFPYIVLETLAAGVPLVATDAGGIPEIFGSDADRLVPAGSADALASAMAATLDDMPAARQLADRLRARVRSEFGIDRMVDSSLDFYAHILATR